MKASQKKQRSSFAEIHFLPCGFLPVIRRLCLHIQPALLRVRAAAFLAPATWLALAVFPTSLFAENDSEKSSSSQGVPQSGAKFLRPPDPSSLPPPLPLPAERRATGSLDLLPSFPSNTPPSNTPNDLNILDLIMRKRENPSLVPDGPNPTEDAALALNKRHRYQAARSHAMNEPQVQGALAAAQKARSDREFREAMRNHYTLLFARMRQLDGSLESLIQERETAALAPLKTGSHAVAATGTNKK